ncbi:WD40 repeat domain-containing protein [Catellatospora tritici]|uniref:WD40 repeat domain-containing protein n=1 Tax=Catellatospora tritici TaxID=2851566 RepID=UPI001C2D81E9|nr:hypothetical protein [Catellatospora tritici]MBV1849384.1 hypothetical protein [Catellatospora tritici]
MLAAAALVVVHFVRWSGQDTPAVAPSPSAAAVGPESPREIAHLPASAYFGDDPKTGLVAFCDGEMIKILDVSKPEEPREVSGVPVAYCSGQAAWNSGAQRVTAVSTYEPASVTVLNVADPRQPTKTVVRPVLADPAGGEAKPRNAVFNDSGTVLAVAESGGVVLWPGALDGRPRPLIKTSDAYALAFHPGGRVLATGVKGGEVVLWNVRNAGSASKIATLRGHHGAVHSIVFSPDGKLMATGGADQSMILWDVSDPAKPVRASATDLHDGAVLSLAFSSSGKTLATGTGFGSATLWNVTDPAKPAKGAVLDSRYIDEAHSVRFRADNRTVMIAGYVSGGDYLVFWDVPGIA